MSEKKPNSVFKKLLAIQGSVSVKKASEGQNCRYQSVEDILKELRSKLQEQKCIITSSTLSTDIKLLDYEIDDQSFYNGKPNKSLKAKGNGLIYMVIETSIIDTETGDSHSVLTHLREPIHSTFNKNETQISMGTQTYGYRKGLLSLFAIAESEIADDKTSKNMVDYEQASYVDMITAEQIVSIKDLILQSGKTDDQILTIGRIDSIDELTHERALHLINYLNKEIKNKMPPQKQEQEQEQEQEKKSGDN